MALVKAFRCSHSGKYYPADYTKQWGRKYGVGLGPVPCSEVRDTDYNQPVAVGANADLSMHPTGVTRAQIDFCLVEEAEYNANRVILEQDDPDFSKRRKIILENQKKNPANKLNQFYPAFQ